MAVYHRTQRLQIYGEKPEVTKLFGDRYRMVVRCKAARDTEAWYNANKDQIFASFGTLYSAQMSVEGIDPRVGEAYPDMCLVSNSASYTQTGEYIISFVYETLTATWTKEQDDEITSTDNGLRVLQRSEVAAIDTAAPYDEDDVGVATITDADKTLYLASFQDQTGAESNAQVGRVVTRWAEAGILSRTEDFVGSQDSLVIEAIGPDPSTPLGFSLASKQESNYEGFQTNRFTFLKDDVQLSQTEDKVGSQLAISQQWFNPAADKTLASYSLASKNTSDFEGIETVEYRFLKDNVVLSESKDRVGSQLAISQEVFNGTPLTPIGYSLASEQESDVDGIPTKRFTFLKDNVELSRSEDLVGSQLAITTQVFNPTTDPIELGYSLARTEASDVEGILTKRYTFLKDNVELARSEDKVGSQLAITTQVFNPTTDPTEAGYSLARKEQSDVDGIPTKRYTFLKPSVLSRSIQTRNNGKLIIETVEAFNEVPTANTVGAVQIGDEVSDVEGIPTRRYTFAKGEGQISVSKRPAESSLAGCTYVTVRSLGTPVTPTGVLVAESETESDGYITYEKTAIQGTITGEKQTYLDVVDVEVPGTVNCTTVPVSSGGVSGALAVPLVTPRRNKKVAATVTVEITDTPPNTASLAYDLGQISCSVTTTNVSLSVGPGSTVTVGTNAVVSDTGYVQNFGASANIGVYPGCYLTAGSSTGTVSYITSSQPVANGNIITRDEASSSRNTSCTGTGSSSATGYSTTGVISRKSRPILTTLDGTTYYEVVTWSV